MKTKIEIEINDIQVDYKNYSFNYSISRDGFIVSAGNYKSKHSHKNNTQAFLRLLESDFAVDCVLDDYVNKVF